MDEAVKKYVPFIQNAFKEFLKLKDDTKVAAVYFKRSEESGRLIYPSFVTRKTEPCRMKAVIFTEGEHYTRYEDKDWFPLTLGVYYCNITSDISLTLATPLAGQEGFKIFDKRYRKDDEYRTLSEYVAGYFSGNYVCENALLTDFPRFGWEHKVKFLNESLDMFPLSNDLIYFAALVHYLAEESFIDIPEWVLERKYYSSSPVGDYGSAEDVPEIFKEHNYYVDRRALERL